MSVSVLIPCHNAESYLGQAVGSVLDQTHPPMEVIVVDDGSTDGSLAVATAFKRHFPGVVRVISERSGQAARTRNIGAAAADGDALMFLDADDVLAPDTLASLVTALSGSPKGIAVCPWYRLERAHGRWMQRPASCEPRDPEQDALAAWLTGWYHPPCSVLWSREAFERSGRWDEVWNPNDDGDLMMRALAAGIPLLESSTGAGFYRRLPDDETSLSDRRTSRKGIRARVRTVKKIACLLEHAGTLHSYRAEIEESLRQIYGHSPNPSDAASGRVRGILRRPEWRAARAEATRRKKRLARRVKALGFNGRAGSSSVADVPQHASGAEITYGLARAEKAADAINAGDSVSVAARGGIHRPSDLDHLDIVDPSLLDHLDIVDPSLLDHPDRPEVTVIIPTFNRAGVLPRAIKSVLAQTFEDFEMIVVDDGSDDDTEQVVASYPDDRVRYLRMRQNRGVAAARNRGLRAARGDLVAFLDSDDEWLPQKLDLQVRLLRESGPDVGLVYTGVESILEDGTREVAPPTMRGEIYDAMLRKNIIHGGGSNAMIRRNVVATVGFFDETFPAIEDYDYWLRISRFFRVDYVDDPLVRYYDHRDIQAAETPRKSLAVADNFAARGLLYRKHRSAMRLAGVAHLFLLETARRHLRPSTYNSWAARWSTLRAFLESPRSEKVHKMMKRIFVPAAIRQILVTGRRTLYGADGV